MYELGQVKTGPFNPRKPDRAGKPFEMVMRDVDGLPLVSESVNGYSRLEEFRFELFRGKSGVASEKPTLLPAEFVGTKLKGADGRWTVLRGQQRPDRSRNGRVEVLVELTYTGRHVINIRGPSGYGEDLSLLHWSVGVDGICPDGQIETDDNLCGCPAGAAKDDSGFECLVCPPGQIKEGIRGECQQCVDRHSSYFGVVDYNGDPHRRETRGATKDAHDQLSDCGCSGEYFLDFDSLSASQVRQSCPVALDRLAWLQPERASLLQRLRAPCCNASAEPDIGGTSDHVGYLDPQQRGCETKLAWNCIARACREEYLTTAVIPVLANSSERATCRPCRPDATTCNETFLTAISLPIQPGFWRPNELSVQFYKCRPGVCVGSYSQHGVLAEDLCREGHWGPQCASCMDGRFKDLRGLCQECRTDNVQLAFYLVLGVTLFLLALAFCVIKGCTTTTGLRKANWRMVKLLGMTSGMQRNAPVLVPKAKTVISMAQIQLGLGPTFRITFPDIFVDFLAFFRVFNFIDLPFECLINFGFKTRLTAYFFLPGSLFLFTLCTAQLSSKAVRSSLTGVAYFFLFLLYPSVTSIAFLTFVCSQYEDGSRFLGVDLSVDCDSPEYVELVLIAAAIIIVYAIGVPILYLYSVFTYRKPLQCVQQLQHFIERADAATKISQQYQEQAAGNNEVMKAKVFRQVHGEMLRSNKRAEISRMQAFKRFHDWYPCFGIELDSESDVPIVKTLWPVYKLHSELSQQEEERGFANYQRYRLLELRNQRAYTPLDSDEETLYAALCRVEAASFHSANAGALSSSGYEMYQGQSNLLIPCKAEWERMDITTRARWLAKDERTLPLRGDRLIAINGRLAPRGERRVDALTGAIWWDHSGTYRMLREAYYRPIEAVRLPDDTTWRDRVWLRLRNFLCCHKPKKAGSHAPLKISPARVKRIWQELFDVQGQEVGVSVAALHGAANALELAMNEYLERQSRFLAMRTRAAMAAATRVALTPARGLQHVFGQAGIERARAYLREQGLERHLVVELATAGSPPRPTGDFVFTSRADEPGSAPSCNDDRLDSQPTVTQVTVTLGPERPTDGRPSFHLEALADEILCRAAESERAWRKLEGFVHMMLHDPEVDEWFGSLGENFRRPQLDEVTLWLEPDDMKGTATSEPKMIKLAKERWNSGFMRKQLSNFPQTIPVYIRNLTDAYDLEYMYWETVECARKAIMLGVPTLLSPGTSQIALGISLAVIFLMLYVQVAPYNAWQTDMLQQFCQLTIFTSLLIELINQARPADATFAEERDHHTRIGWLLVSVTAFSAMLAIPMALMERPGFPYWLQGKLDAFRVMLKFDKLGAGQFTDTAHLRVDHEEQANQKKARDQMARAYGDTPPHNSYRRVAAVVKLRDEIEKFEREPARNGGRVQDLERLVYSEHARTLLIMRHKRTFDRVQQFDGMANFSWDSIMRILQATDIQGLRDGLMRPFESLNMWSDADTLGLERPSASLRLAMLERVGASLAPVLAQHGVAWDSIRPSLLREQVAPHLQLVALLHPTDRVLRDLGRLADQELMRRLVALFHAECVPAHDAETSGHWMAGRVIEAISAGPRVSGRDSDENPALNTGRQGHRARVEPTAWQLEATALRRCVRTNYTRIPWVDVRRILEVFSLPHLLGSDEPPVPGNRESLLRSKAPFMPESGPTRDQWDRYFTTETGHRIVLQMIVRAVLRSALAEGPSSLPRITEPVHLDELLIDEFGNVETLMSEDSDTPVSQQWWVEYVLPTLANADVYELHHIIAAHDRPTQKCHAMTLIQQNLLQRLQPKFEATLLDVLDLSWEQQVEPLLRQSALPQQELVARLIDADIRSTQKPFEHIDVVHSNDEVLQHFMQIVADCAENSQDPSTCAWSRRVLINWLRPLSSRGPLHWTDTEEGTRALENAATLDELKRALALRVGATPETKASETAAIASILSRRAARRGTVQAEHVLPSDIEHAVEEWRSAQLRVSLQPLLRKIGVEWEDVQPSVQLVRMQVVGPDESISLVQSMLALQEVLDLQLLPVNSTVGVANYLSVAPHRALASLLLKEPEDALRDLLIIRLCKALQRELNEYVEATVAVKRTQGLHKEELLQERQSADLLLVEVIFCILTLLPRLSTRAEYYYTVGTEPGVLLGDLELMRGFDAEALIDFRAQLVRTLNLCLCERFEYACLGWTPSLRWEEEVRPILAQCSAPELCLFLEQSNDEFLQGLHSLHRHNAAPIRRSCAHSACEVAPLTAAGAPGALDASVATGKQGVEQVLVEVVGASESAATAMHQSENRQCTACSPNTARQGFGSSDAPLSNPVLPSVTQPEWERKRQLVARLRPLMQLLDGLEWRDCSPLIMEAFTEAALAHELEKPSRTPPHQYFRKLRARLRTRLGNAAVDAAYLRSHVDSSLIEQGLRASRVEQLGLDWKRDLAPVVDKLQSAAQRANGDGGQTLPGTSVTTIAELVALPAETALRQLLIAKITACPAAGKLTRHQLEQLRSGLDNEMVVDMDLLVTYSTDPESLLDDWEEAIAAWEEYERSTPVPYALGA